MVYNVFVLKLTLVCDNVNDGNKLSKWGVISFRVRPVNLLQNWAGYLFLLFLKTSIKTN